MEVSPSVVIGAIVFVAIGLSILLPIFFQGVDIWGLWGRVRPQLTSWSRRELDDHTSRLIDLEKRVSSLEAIESELFRDSIGPPSRIPPESAEEPPVSSVSSGGSSGGDSGEILDVEPISQARDIMVRLRKNWSNASANDRDRVIELLDAYLNSEVPF